MNIYICTKHGVSETSLGDMSFRETRATVPCIVCKNEALKQLLEEACGELEIWSARDGFEYRNLFQRVKEALK